MAGTVEPQEREQPAGTRAAPESAFMPTKRSRARLMVVLVVALLAIGTGGYLYWQYASAHESTDDAQIDGHIHAISPRVGGSVIKTLVKNNDWVEAGAVLVEIDPSDYQVAVGKAKADLAQAEANLRASRTQTPIVETATSSELTGAVAGVSEVRAAITVSEKQIPSAEARLRSALAQVEAAKANADRSSRDLERMKVLIGKEEISQQQFDAVSAAADLARAQLESARALAGEAQQGVHVAQSQLEEQKAKLARAEAAAAGARTGPQQVAASQARTDSASANVMQMRANLEQAELALSYTVIRAPVSGIIGQKNVEVGQTVQASQPLMAVVPAEDIWVTANFKENQLAHIRPGQPATVSVDAYGGRKYRAHVDSIAAATGARFSLLPPENATGNFVKVVQRVPVKIVFEKGQDPDHLLRLGMSVVPTISIR